MNNGLYDPYANTQSPANPYTGFGAQAAPSTPAIPQSYQIKKSDTFASIGSQFNMDEKKLQDMNKMLVTPPKGSFITLARPGFAVGPQTSGGAQQQGSYGAYGSQVPGTAQPQQQTQMGGGGGMAQQFSNPRAIAQAQVNQYVAAGMLPPEVSYYTPIINPATGQPATDIEMQANGYAFDPVTKKWKLPGTGGAPAATTPTFSTGTGTYGTLRDARQAQRRRRIAKGANDVQSTGPGATNAGGTPTSVLELHLGSG